MDSDKVERLRERLLQCAICMDEYKDPRILPCHHTLCYECIENVVRSTSSSGRLFRCPQCRSDVCVPKGGIQDLPINFYIISLQDELGSSGYSGTCDVCRRDWLVTQFRCIDCDLDICRFCIHAHRLETHSSPPKILRVESTAVPDQLASSQTCTDHPDGTLQLFCCSCNVAICISCSCGTHKRHNIIPMTVKLQQSQLYLQEQLEKLTAEKRNLARAGSVLEKAKSTLRETSNKALLSVDAAAHRACDTIMDKKSQVVKEIIASEQNQIQQIDNAMKDFVSYAQRIERGIDFLLDLQDSDICLEVVDTYKEFTDKLKAARNDFVSNQISLEQYRFMSTGASGMYETKLGFSRRFYHFGRLGSLGKRKMGISIDSKTMEVVTKPSMVVRLMESSLFHLLLRFLITLLYLQILFFILDITGVSDKLLQFSTCIGGEIMSFLHFFP